MSTKNAQRFTRDVRNRIRQEKSTGASYAVLAKNYGCCVDTVRYLTREHRALRQKIKQFCMVGRKKTGMGFSCDDFIAVYGTQPRCRLCGDQIDLVESEAYALDHITSRSEGGDNSLTNCQPLCIECNWRKHSSSVAALDAWILKRIRNSQQLQFAIRTWDLDPG